VYADLDLPLMHVIAIEDVDRVSLHRVGGNQERVRFLPRDDIRLNAHAGLQRRIVGQVDADAVGFCNRVSHRGDLADFSLDASARKRIGAQQHRLSFANARNVLFVHLGHHLQGLWHADAEQHLAGFGDFADLAVAAQQDAIHRRNDRVVGKLLGLHRD
jgi:hypothetical protein